jgi:hypothetical protein
MRFSSAVEAKLAPRSPCSRRRADLALRPATAERGRLDAVPHASRARRRWAAVHRRLFHRRADCRALMRRCPVQRRERLAGVRADTQRRAAGPLTSRCN